MNVARKIVHVVKESLIIINLLLAAIILGVIVLVGTSLVARLGSGGGPPTYTPPTSYPTLVPDDPTTAHQAACDEMKANGANPDALRAYGCAG